MNRPVQSLLAILLIAALSTALATGCGLFGSNNKATVSGPGKPVRGGNLIIGLSEEPENLNPFTPEGTSFATKLVTSNMLWGLLVTTPSLTYAPRIAETVPTLENGLVTSDPFTVTYKIREEAVWSDGEPITSWDVEFTWQTIMDPKRAIPDRSGYDMIESIQTPDEKTVKLIFKEPYAHYKELFSTTYCILPKHLLQDRSYDDLLSEMITFSSGPYRFKKWSRGQTLSVVRNENFWGDEAYIDRVTFKFIPDPDDLIRSFEEGKVDAVYPPSDIERIERLITLTGKTVRINPGLVWEHVGFNVRGPHLSDEGVRKAIAHAIDREKIAEAAIGKKTVLQSIVMPEHDRYYVPAWEQYDFDLNTTRELLAKAGYRRGPDGVFEKDGKRLALTISTSKGSPSREAAVKIMKDDFARAGISLDVKNSSAAAFFDSRLPAGEFDIGLWAWLAGDEPRLDHIFAADMTPPAGFNYYGYKDEFLTDAVERIERTIDLKERTAVYRIVQDKIGDDAVVIPLYQRPQVIAFDGRVGGVRNNISFEGPFWNLHEWWVAK